MDERIIKVQQAVARAASSLYPNITADDVMIVWYCKTIQNFKALAITNRFRNYYEVTYNGDKDEYYVDLYKKYDKIVYKGANIND